MLEHCPEQQAELGIMEEILRATTTLAQDQYGNYVVQHVLEHGQPAEKKDICTKLAGQIVAMSQHKFARWVPGLFMVHEFKVSRATVRDLSGGAACKEGVGGLVP